ncbi:MAG: hypothetical protein A4E67_01293 [Syntrophaceae bacterium PtaB.Bin038]|nr:MAG: hypothetical protein A4E67_01293 [Syntrophaceae bacterium PtaB.Bin038]
MKASRFLFVLLLFLLICLGAIPDAAAAEKTIRLKIEACDCPTTVPQVNFILQTTPGIVKHDINAFTREATVTFDDKKTSSDTIRERLAKGGFTSEEVDIAR